jgi:hypothetical protein
VFREQQICYFEKQTPLSRSLIKRTQKRLQGRKNDSVFVFVLDSIRNLCHRQLPCTSSHLQQEVGACFASRVKREEGVYNEQIILVYRELTAQTARDTILGDAVIKAAGT